MKNTFRHIKPTLKSSNNNNIVKTYSTSVDQVRHDEVIKLLKQIKKLLKKLSEPNN